MLTEKEPLQDWLPVTCSSRIDALNVDRFKSLLTEKAAEAQRLALDLRGVEFVNFEAIRHIHLVAVEMEERGGELALVGPTEKLKRQVSLFASLDPIRIFSKREWEALS